MTQVVMVYSIASAKSARACAALGAFPRRAAKALSRMACQRATSGVPCTHWSLPGRRLCQPVRFAESRAARWANLESNFEWVHLSMMVEF